MYTIKVALLHHVNPSDELLKKGKKALHKILQACSYTITDKNPDLLFFISGGSEQGAIRYISEDRFPLLLADKENNAFAAASEVLAWCKNRNIPSKLFIYTNPDALNEISEYIHVKRALASLDNKTIGLIGTSSDWLINSTVEAENLKKVTGITLKAFPWVSMPDYKEYECPDKFYNAFSNTSHEKLEGSGKVYAMFHDHIRKEDLKGITVECFSLVQRDHITACLPLALINSEDIPAACEGDTVSLAGMMIIQALTGSIPWMANIVEIGDEDITFAHCTIPRNMLSSHYITTHYETGEGTAVKGVIEDGKYTIIRFNKDLDQIFVTEATTMPCEDILEACRTQAKFAINKNDAKLLKDKPLGNHHLIVKGWYGNILKKMAEVMQLNDNQGGCPKITW